MSAFAYRSRSPRLVGCGLLALASIVLGGALAQGQSVDLAPGLLALALAGAAAVATLIVLGPIACIAAILALTIAGGWIPGLGAVGDVDLLVSDVFYAALVLWWLMDVAHRSERGQRRPRIDFGQGPALLFLGYTGLTLLNPAVADTGSTQSAVVSWLSFAQTASLAWLSAVLIRTRRDLDVLLWVIALATAAAVLVAVIGGGFSDREAGVLTPNSLGLVSGLVLLMALFAPIARGSWGRAAFALIGCAGLVQSASAAALIATSFAAIGGAALGWLPRGVSPGSRLGTALLALVAAGVVAVGAVQLVRPDHLPYSEGFKTSSAYHRVIVGVAGLEIAADNAVFGIGWRQSSSPAVIGAPELGAELRRRFPFGRSVFFPQTEPGSVHNAYVQILAELGIVGLALFVFAVVAVGSRVRRVLTILRPDSELGRYAWWMGFGLVLALIWLNDNPLFGGQVETLIPAVLVGALAAMAAMTRSRGLENRVGEPSDAAQAAR